MSRWDAVGVCASIVLTNVLALAVARAMVYPRRERPHRV